MCNAANNNNDNATHQRLSRTCSAPDQVTHRAFPRHSAAGLASRTAPLVPDGACSPASEGQRSSIPSKHTVSQCRMQTRHFRSGSLMTSRSQIKSRT